jgi:mRNA interferase YafQ
MVTVVKILATAGELPVAYKDHALSGNWNGRRECHITPDWLLIYKISDDVLVLTLTRTGTHSDLFNH